MFRSRCFLALSFAALSSAAAAAPGDLDVRFGGNGAVLVGNGGLDETVYALLPEADNAVVAGGRMYEVLAGRARGGATGNDMTLLRLLGDGQLDAAWGEGGYAQIGFGGDSEYVRDVVRQPDGKYVAVGALERGSYTDFGVARFTADGFQDYFGEAPLAGRGVARRGAIAFNMGPDEFTNDEGVAIALQSTGRIVVAGIGFATDGNFKYPRFAIAGLTPDGDLDPGFAGEGRAIAAPLGAGASEYVTAIAKHRDGSLSADDGFVVAGYTDAGNRAVLRRFKADGTPDTQFGNGSAVAIISGNGSGMFRIDDAVLQDDGRIVVVGRGNERGYVFMRFLANGTPDTSFGTAGRTLVKFSGPSDYDEPEALALQADGRIVAAGMATSRETGAPRADFASVRLLRNGLPDPSYGDGSGRSTYPVVLDADVARAVTLTSDGSVLLAGEADVAVANGDRDAAFLRLQGDPRLFADGFED